MNKPVFIGFMLVQGEGNFFVPSPVHIEKINYGIYRWINGCGDGELFTEYESCLESAKSAILKSFSIIKQIYSKKTDLSKILGTWPGEVDDGFEKDINEHRHGYSNWQPIDTAPQDGSRFVVCFRMISNSGQYSNIITARYFQRGEYWTSDGEKLVWKLRDGKIEIQCGLENVELLGWMRPELPSEVVK